MQILDMVKKDKKATKDDIQLVRNVIGNYLVKGLAMLVSIIITPAYMSYFYSNKLLGMWYTALSLLNWVMIFDFGIGGGIRNQLVEPLRKDDKESLGEILASGFFSIGSIVLGMLLIQQFIVETINWYPIFGLTTQDISESSLKLMVHILVIGIVIRFFSVLSCHILYAMQQATVPSVLVLISNCLILIYLKLATPVGREADIINLSIVHAVATNIPTIIALGFVLIGPLRGVLPKYAKVKKSRIKSILGTGTSLFYLQILITLVFGVKELFITWFAGADQVVYYNVYYKLIGLICTIFSVTLTPVWSAVTKAYVEHDYKRIKKLYKAGILLIGIFSIIQIAVVVAMPVISEIWLGENNITISYSYGFLFCIYNVFYMWIMLNYNFACGMGKTRRMSIGLTMAIFLNVIFAYLWCSINPVWINVIMATVVAVIPCAIMEPFAIIKLSRNEKSNIQDKNKER